MTFSFAASGYTLHTLTNSDILRWTEFCASCFSYKPNPPPASYFGRHFYNDPKRNPSLIRVMKSEIILPDGEKEIVASTRVFSREISLGNGKSCEAGGIGEVCTHPSHRKLGLAKQLLLESIRAMDDIHMKCSLLHASPQLTQVYERSAAYRAVTSHWTVIPLRLEFENSDHATRKEAAKGSRAATETIYETRLASFPKDTTALKIIHKTYSEDRFAGCIIRSTEYWNEYLSEEIGDSLFVLVRRRDDDTDGDANEEIIAWMSLRPRSDVRFQLRDFGCKRTKDDEGCRTIDAFPLLLKNAAKAQLESNDTISEDRRLELHIPSEILKEMQEEGLCEKNHWVDWSREIYQEDDVGWMYKSLGDGDGDGKVDIWRIVEEMNVPHLIWPSDSF